MAQRGGRPWPGPEHLAEYRSGYALSVALLEESIALLGAAATSAALAWSLARWARSAGTVATRELASAPLDEEPLARGSVIAGPCTTSHAWARSRGAPATSTGGPVCGTNRALCCAELWRQAASLAALQTARRLSREPGGRGAGRGAVSESLALHRHATNKAAGSTCWVAAGETALGQDAPERAARLGGAQARREAYWRPRRRPNATTSDPRLGPGQRAPGRGRVYGAGWTEGRAMTMEQACGVRPQAGQYPLGKYATASGCRAPALPETELSERVPAPESDVAQDSAPRWS